MKIPGKRAGESRRSRRHALKLTVTLPLVIGLALLIAFGRSPARGGGWNLKAGPARTDVENATQLLQAVNGASPILCGAVERAFSTGYWGGNAGLLMDDDMSPSEIETIAWIGHSRLNPSVLDVARPGLASSDACTRRVAARIAGNTNVARLDRVLESELNSAMPATRLAALVAVGHAEVPEASRMFITLLQQDKDPQVRRIAAWALGQLE